MIKSILILFVLSSAIAATAAPAPFQLPQELIKKAPETLRIVLKKNSVASPQYTATSMQILENRIHKKMKLMDFTLNCNEAAKAMDSADHYTPENQMIRLTPGERKKMFEQGGQKVQILIRYNKSFKIRQEIIKLFRQCVPAMPENRFHSAFFSLLEFQHIYLEREVLKLRDGRR